MQWRRIFVSSLVTVAMVASAKAQTQTEYLAVLMDGKKIGYAKMVRKVADGRVTHSTDLKIAITRSQMSLQMKMFESTKETADGKPLAFTAIQDMGSAVSKTTGKVTGEGKLQVTTTAMGQTRQQTVDWPAGALMPEGARLVGLKKGLTEGTTYTIKIFETSSQQALDVKVRVGRTAPVDLLGRVVTLTKVTATMQSPLGELTTTSWVDKDQNALRTIVPMMGTTLEMVACSKDIALSPNDVADFFDKVVLKSPRPLKDVAGAKSITYTLQAKDGKALKIPTTDNQKAAAGSDGQVLLTVRPVQTPKGQAFPYTGTHEAARKALKPTRFVQSDDAKVITLARKAVGDTKDAAEAARRIEKFVRRHIKKKDLSVGYASAAEVARSGQGDCTEHAVLTAAMCRAAGIPAQVVMGVAYVEEFAGSRHIFGPHAWNRVFIGGKWVGLDATFPGGYDAGHIALGTGEGNNPSEFFGIVNTLGCFKIAKVVMERRTAPRTVPAGAD